MTVFKYDLPLLTATPMRDGYLLITFTGHGLSCKWFPRDELEEETKRLNSILYHYRSGKR